MTIHITEGAALITFITILFIIVLIPWVVWKVSEVRLIDRDKKFEEVINQMFLTARLEGLREAMPLRKHTTVESLMSDEYYKSLLKRFIEHVECIEGHGIVDRSTPSRKDVQLTKEERDVLNSLSIEQMGHDEWPDLNAKVGKSTPRVPDGREVIELPHPIINFK